MSCYLGLSEDVVLQTRTVLTNTGTTDFVVSAVRSVLPVGTGATELLDLTGFGPPIATRSAVASPGGGQHLGSRLLRP